MYIKTINKVIDVINDGINELERLLENYCEEVLTLQKTDNADELRSMLIDTKANEIVKTKIEIKKMKSLKERLEKEIEGKPNLKIENLPYIYEGL